MRNPLKRRIVLAGMAAIGLLLLPGTTPAQQTQLDSRWYAWLGCWQPETTDPTAAGASPVVCVLPAQGAAGIEVATIRDGEVSDRERIDATGARISTDRDGCTGWTAADWSADGNRVYRRSEYSCPGGIERASTGLMAMSPTGEWVDVEGLAVGEQEAVRVLRYRPAGGAVAVPAEVTTRLQGIAMAASTARMAASAPVTTDEVVEAAGRVGPGVAEAWLVERGQGFALELDADRLVELERAGVPDRVIDMVVALSYPDRFAIDRESGQAGLRPGEAAGRTSARDVRGYPGYGWGYYPGYGYGSLYGYGYGYGRYGYGYGRYYDRPIVVVRDPDTGGSGGSGGRVVRGRGYTRDTDSGASTTRPTSRPSAPAASSGGSGSSGNSGGASTGRTAKPRS